MLTITVSVRPSTTAAGLLPHGASVSARSPGGHAPRRRPTRTTFRPGLTNGVLEVRTPKPREEAAAGGDPATRADGERAAIDASRPPPTSLNPRSVDPTHPLRSLRIPKRVTDRGHDAAFAASRSWKEQGAPSYISRSVAEASPRRVDETGAGRLEWPDPRSRPDTCTRTDSCVEPIRPDGPAGGGGSSLLAWPGSTRGGSATASASVRGRRSALERCSPARPRVGRAWRFRAGGSRGRKADRPIPSPPSAPERRLRHARQQMSRDCSPEQRDIR